MAKASLMTPAQVAERLQVNERTVTHWLRTGRLRGFKIVKEWRVSEDDVEAFINESVNDASQLKSFDI